MTIRTQKSKHKNLFLTFFSNWRQKMEFLCVFTIQTQHFVEMAKRKFELNVIIHILCDLLRRSNIEYKYTNSTYMRHSFLVFLDFINSIVHIFTFSLRGVVFIRTTRPDECRHILKRLAILRWDWLSPKSRERYFLESGFRYSIRTIELCLEIIVKSDPVQSNVFFIQDLEHER